MNTTAIKPEDPPDIRISFPGGKRVDAALGSRVIRTDQPSARGGSDSAPGPFDLFLAALGTCAGFYVLSFCQARGIPIEGIELVQHHRLDVVTHGLRHVELELRLPPTFPEKSRAAVVQAAAGCKLKRLLMAPPEGVVTATVMTSGTAPPAAASGPRPALTTERNPKP